MKPQQTSRVRSKRRQQSSAAESAHAVHIQGQEPSVSISLPKRASRPTGLSVPDATISAYSAEHFVPLASVEALGARIRQARIEQGHTQQKFADLVGVGRRFLSELETGKPTLEIGKVLQVASAAGVPIFVRE